MRRFLKAICIFLSLAFAFTAVTFCWFSQDELVNLRDDFGSAKASYFKSGNGSKSNKYVIASATHFYNFAWLQYLGYFNHGKNGHNGRYQSYFEIDASLKLEGIDLKDLNSALPPIGTAEYPFIGNFEGNGVVIKNYTVSNEESALTKRPSAANFKDGVLALRGDGTQEVSTVGLFGITGDKDGVVSDVYGIYSETNKTGIFKDTANSQTAVPDAGVDKDEAYYSAMSVSNFYADDLSVNSVSANTLVGLAAGYANAAIEKVGVYHCGITVNANADGLQEGEAISKYSLLGDFNSDVVSWGEIASSGGTSGDENAWGGSIDMKALWDRIGSFIGTDNSTDYKYFSEERKGTVYAKFSSGLYLYMKNQSETEPTYLPLNVNDDGTVDTEKNTGYIGATTDNNSVRIIKKTWDSSCSDKTAIYTKTKATNGVAMPIKDMYNTQDSTANNVAELGLNVYQYEKNGETLGARENFETLLKNSDVYGLRFMSDSDGAKVMNERYTAKHAGMLGQEYTNYDMTQSSIDCKLKSPGYINFFAVTNFNTGTQPFFSLYEIERNEDDITTISSVKEISKIYKLADSSAYLYEYKGEVLSGVTEEQKVFDRAWITTPETAKRIYYFEIPVNAGEYALGSASGTSTGGASLVYLDLQANGSGDSGGDKPEKPYSIATLDFVNSTANPLSTAYADVVAKISKSSASQSGASKIEFERAAGTSTNSDGEINTVLYYVLTNFNEKDVIFTPESLSKKSPLSILFKNN